MMRVELTDGVNRCSAVETSRVQHLDVDTLCPGTKLLLPARSRVVGGLLWLDSGARVLGGRVPHLAEQWELQRSLARIKRTGGGADQPPPFQPFSKVLFVVIS